jgi:hypothetical protein
MIAPKYNASELARFVKLRYPGGHWNKATGTYFKGTHEYRDEELIEEMAAERDAWTFGYAEKPEWIKK